MEHQVPPDDVGDVETGLDGEPFDEVTLAHRSEAPDRGEVLLFVEQQPAVVHVAVEVDGELRDPRQRAIDLDERGVASCGDDAS